MTTGCDWVEEGIFIESDAPEEGRYENVFKKILPSY